MTDHTDIVERLLTCSRQEFPRDASEAAAEITRLRAEAEALRKFAINARDSAAHSSWLYREACAAIDATKGTT